MPRFAILLHESPQGLHWDLLLESGDVLNAWSLPQPPEPGVEMTCRGLADHRPMYLDYEGPVSGDRGTVTRWDHGSYQIVRRDETQWVVDFSGEKLSGLATLEQVADDPQQWRLMVHGS